MKTLQELYKEIPANDDLKASFVEASKSGKALDFLKEKGCETTAEELTAFLKSQTGELSDEELDNASGGTCNEQTACEALLSTFSAGIICATVYLLSSGSQVDHNGQRTETEGRLCNQNHG